MINLMHSINKDLNLLYCNIQHIGHIQIVIRHLYINTYIHTQSDYIHAHIYSTASLVTLHTDPVHVFIKLMLFQV